MRERPSTSGRTVQRRAVLSVVLGLLATAALVGACGADDQSKRAAQKAPASASTTAKQANDKLTLVTASGRHDIHIEVADTEEKKQVGLMFRTSLDDGFGMLFPYREPQEITMWMRNTYVSLDMVFIRADGIVHRVERNTEPMSEAIIASNGLASAVLELKAGAAAHYQIGPGSKVEHPVFASAGGR